MIKIETVGKPYMRYLAKVIPLAFDESMSYYEFLCNVYNYLKNEVAPVINNNAEALEELRLYVENYFDNLDIQEEVDNKLEEMYENGQLATLVTQFLQLQALFVYNTVNEMVASENLANGSIAKTLNFNEGDNGGAYYKIRTITNEDVIDNITLFAITNSETLVAELIPEYKMNTKQFGFITNEDNTTRFSKIIDYINDNIIKELNINEGVYTISDKFVIDDIDNLTITGEGTLDNGNSETAFLEIKNGSNINIENITIKSEYQYTNPTNTSDKLGCLCIDTCSNFNIKNVKINKINAGLFVINSSNGVICNNFINDCKSWGLMIGEYGSHNIYPNNDLLIYSNICTNGYDGIKLTGYIKNISIYDNLCTNNSRDGIDYAGFSADNIYLYNNKISNNALNGIEFKQLIRSTYTPDPERTLVFRNIEIDGNKIVNHERGGINMEVYYNDNDSVNNIVIKNNNIKNDAVYQASDKGIQIFGFNTTSSNALTIINNIIEGLHYDIHLTNVNNTVIKNNILKYCISVPIRVEYDSDIYTTYNIPFNNLIIKDNEIRNNISANLFNGNTLGRTNITNIVIENNLMEFVKASVYAIDNNYMDAGNIVSINNYYYEKYDTQPSGRSQKNMIYYSKDPSTTGCIGWISTTTGSSPTYKQYIPIN